MMSVQRCWNNGGVMLKRGNEQCIVLGIGIREAPGQNEVTSSLALLGTKPRASRCGPTARTGAAELE
jgi:hypothetical protein